MNANNDIGEINPSTRTRQKADEKKQGLTEGLQNSTHHNKHARIKLRALVASDCPEGQQQLAMTMEQCGYHVTPAFNTLEAFYVVQLSEPFDIIVLDTTVTETASIKNALHIRALMGRKGRVPIIGIVGSIPCLDKGQLMDAGFNELCPLPIQQNALHHICKRALVSQMNNMLDKPAGKEFVPPEPPYTTLTLSVVECETP